MVALLQDLEAEAVEHEGLAHFGNHPRLMDHEARDGVGLVIVAEAFRAKSRVEQYRMVNAVLAEELKERVHALAIQASAHS